MKKTYLFACLAACFALCLASACSDDENTDWKQIPTEDIKLDGTGTVESTLTFNDVPVKSGNIKFNVENAKNAAVVLTNVVPGYAQDSIPVKLTELPNRSWAFEGTGSEAAPCMLTKNSPLPRIMLLNAKGTISAMGDTVNIQVSSLLADEAQGGIAGTWKLKNTITPTDDSLAGPIKDGPVTVKWAIDSVVAKSNFMAAMIVALAPDLLTNMITPLLSEVLNTVTFDKSGNILASYKMTLPDITDSKTGEVLASKEDVQEWASTFLETNINWGEGKIVPVDNNWLDSPKNVCLWYVFDEQLYIVPQIYNVINAVPGSNVDAANAIITTLLTNGVKATIVGLLEGMKQQAEAQGKEPDIQINGLDAMLSAANIDDLVIQFIGRGIPLKYAVNGSELKVYIDTEMAVPYLQLIVNVLDNLTVSADAAQNNQMLGMISNLKGMLIPALKGTSELEIGLTFIK